MPFTENFLYLKKQTGLTNYQIAKALDCSQSSIKNWVEGTIIPRDRARLKIAEYFGITLAELDGDELPVLPPESAKKAPDPKIEGLSELQKVAIQFVLSLPPEKLERFIKMGRAAFEKGK